jgi:hypothetical protein
MPAALPSLREGTRGTSSPLEPIKPLLAPVRAGVNQHPTRSAGDNFGSILDQDHLIGSQGVPPSQKENEFAALPLNAFTWPTPLSKRKQWKWLLEWGRTWIEA